MPLVKTCLSCNRRMLPLGSERLRSYFRNPRQVKCPHCGTLFQWSRGRWYVAHAGAVVTAFGTLGLLGLTVKLILPTYTLSAFAITGLGIGIMYVSIWRMRLEE